MRERRLGSRSLTVSASFKEGKMARRGALVRPSLDADEFINLLHGSNPMKMDLNRLENEVRGQLGIKGALPSFGFLFLDKQQIERLSNRNIGTIAYDIVQVPYYCGWGNVDGQIRKKTTSYGVSNRNIQWLLSNWSFFLSKDTYSSILNWNGSSTLGYNVRDIPDLCKRCYRKLGCSGELVGAWAVSYTFNFMMEWSSTTTFMFYDMFCTLAVLFVAKEEASSRLLRSAIS
nr:microtubule-associated protein 70-1-like [Ipomoea trifida]